MKNRFSYVIYCLAVVSCFFTILQNVSAQVWERAHRTHRSTTILAAGDNNIFSVGNGAHLFQSADLGTTFIVDIQDTPITGLSVGSGGKYYASSPSGLYVKTGLDSDWVLIDSTGVPKITALYVRQVGGGVDDIYAGTAKGLWYRRSTSSQWTKKFDANDGAPILQITSYNNNFYYRTKADAYGSYDGGLIWSPIHHVPETGGFSISSIVATSENDVFLAIRSAKSEVLHSSNKGSDDNWSGPKILNLGDAYFNTLISNEFGDLFLGGGFHDPIKTDSVTHGFVWRVMKGEQNWSDFSGGLPTSEVVGIGFSSGGKVIASTDTLGTFRTKQKLEVTPSRSFAGVLLSSNFPNPSLSNTQFFVTNAKSITASIAVFDALGRNVSQLFDGNLSEGKHTFTIATKDFPIGTYFYRLTSASAILTKAFVVTR